MSWEFEDLLSAAFFFFSQQLLNMQYSIINQNCHAIHYLLRIFYFVTGSLYLMTTFTNFSHFCTSCFWLPPIFLSTYIYTHTYIHILLVCLDFTYKWSLAVCVFLYLNFTKHNALKLHPCHKWQDFTFSDGWIIFHCACVHACVYVSHFLYPFIHQWILQLCPQLDCLNNAAMNMVGYAYILGAGVFVFFGKYPKVELLDHMTSNLWYLQKKESPYISNQDRKKIIKWEKCNQSKQESQERTKVRKIWTKRKNNINSRNKSSCISNYNKWAKLFR